MLQRTRRCLVPAVALRARRGSYRCDGVCKLKYGDDESQVDGSYIQAWQETYRCLLVVLRRSRLGGFLLHSGEWLWHGRRRRRRDRDGA
ncbi:hypothetical protein ISCGN_026615 [Ixodes scapularis]